MDDEATAEVAAYVYTPLSQPQGIRVATLLPGVKTDLFVSQSMNTA
jgi:hypothetical protein